MLAVAIAALLISRIPTLSVKTVKVPARAVAPLLVLVGLARRRGDHLPVARARDARSSSTCAHLPYAVRRYLWLAEHPEAWDVPPQERRAIRRAHGASPPARAAAAAARRVAGAAKRAVSAARRNGNGNGQRRMLLPPARTAQRRAVVRGRGRLAAHRTAPQPGPPAPAKDQ